MSKHIELATPCPNCQSRLTLSVRRTLDRIPCGQAGRARTVATSTGTTTTYRTGGHGFRPSNNAPTVTTASSAGGGGERTDTGVRMPKLRGVSARVKQKHRTPDVPHRHMPVRILLGQGLALSALRMADRDQNRKNADILEKSAVPRRFGRSPTAVLRRAGVRPHHRDRR